MLLNTSSFKKQKAEYRLEYQGTRQKERKSEKCTYIVEKIQLQRCGGGYTHTHTHTLCISLLHSASAATYAMHVPCQRDRDRSSSRRSKINMRHLPDLTLPDLTRDAFKTPAADFCLTLYKKFHFKKSVKFISFFILWLSIQGVISWSVCVSVTRQASKI